MANVEFKVDTSEMQKMNRWFNDKDWEKIKKRTLNKAAAHLKKDAKKSFKSVLPAATKKNPKYNDRLIDAIRSSKVEETGLSEYTVKVHVMGNRKKGSGTYSARFFEGGTKERTMPSYVDKLGRKYPKSRSIGSIEALHYFQDTISNLNKVKPDINGLLETEINKVNTKKFK